MGENEPGHRSFSEHTSIELWSRWNKRWKILSKLLVMVEPGNVKVTMKTACDDRRTEDSGAQKVVFSAREIACRGRQDFNLGSDGGFMIPVHSNIGHEMMMHFER